MSDSFFVQLCFPLGESKILGTIEATSLKDSQAKIVDVLQQNGVPEENIICQSSGNWDIGLKGGLTIRTARVLPVEEWRLCIPALIAYER